MAKQKKDNSNSDGDLTFKLVDKATVSRLQKDGEVQVPAKKVNVPKDKQWNTKQLGSKLLQGIQNGDSVQSIAKGFMEVVDNNWVSAIRNARTMTTSAECHGRLDSYEDLAEQGVVIKKVWIATPDSRTRESHLELDGEEVDVDEAFSNGCQFPGDGNGPPEEVWNCRCSIKSHIVGRVLSDGTIKYLDSEPDETIHDRQIEEERERREEKGSQGKETENNKSAIHSEEEQISAIHNYQQVSHEGITQDEREAIYDYIESHDDVKEQVTRGMTVQQSTIDNWIKSGEINTNGMTSWTTDGSVATRFAEVSRNVDAEDGKRSVIIVSKDGLPMSARLPRTNAYSEYEVLTLFKNYEIIDYRIDQNYSRENKSPTVTIIFVRPKRR